MKNLICRSFLMGLLTLPVFAHASALAPEGILSSVLSNKQAMDSAKQAVGASYLRSTQIDWIRENTYEVTLELVNLDFRCEALLVVKQVNQDVIVQSVSSKGCIE